MESSLLRYLLRPALMPLLLALCLLALPGRASHIRAGDIQAKPDTTPARNPLRIFFKMVTYTDSNSPADTPSQQSSNEATIFFGDGTSLVAVRLPPVQLANNVRRSVYYFEHTYNAAGLYVVSHIGELRATGIRNVPQSENRSFYIHTQVNINPIIGINHSPELNAPAVDRAASGQVYLHNPAASDADGDSLVYRLRVCQYEPRTVASIVSTDNTPRPVDIPGYTFPNVSSGGNQVPYSGPPVSGNGPSILEMDVRTGQMVWNAPNLTGDYNVAFVVEEWRRDAFGGRRKIGEVVRDMQITVFASSNRRPVITVPRDTCVVAGTTITRTVTATDPDDNLLRLSAYGGMLPAPASFQQIVNIAGRAVGRFSWATSCADVASDPQLVVFKVEDVPASGQTLIDERPWRITVVGPPPTGLRAVAAGTAATLTWDRYVCQNATRILIYRKENQSGWSPGSCEAGIPASAGYTLVGEVAANLQTYTDTNGGRGLERGKTYCYRIYAEFPRPAGGASIASQEACVPFDGRAMLFTNVTVERTDAATGQIGVRWTAPAPAANFAAPLGYRLYRAEDQGSNYTLVRTATSLTDTTHTDTNLNTRDRAYTYRLEFFRATPEVVEPAGPASSVRLTATPNPGVVPTIGVTWAYNVPWNNSGNVTRVYRKNPGSATFTLISSTAAGTRTEGSYLDNDPALRLNQTYCYYVETVGRYDSPRQPQNLVNRSQELCVLLAPRPCRPVLSLQGPDCDRLAELARQFPSPLPRPLTFTNNLSWTLSNQPAGCSPDIVEYRVLYSPVCDSAAFQEIGRVPGSSTTTTFTFAHTNLTSAAGCYRILAVDGQGTSAASNIVTSDNCRIFVLPNVFSPNNDQQNDTFRPIFASPVTQVNVKIFNRWGARVYEGKASQDLRLWDGGGTGTPDSGGRDSGAKATAGTYYYLVEVEFADQARTRQTFKGWVEVISR
ncbi:gliding motility-associated C-terminal domain-containing protein [Hymenobacter edaphi]|uniref:Gliding motility-associated C-terminal domain-containing protein n=1 Tax=Hymenobacter edaphi TaxID=2211146 RepID=A0A328BSU1_9BACT|nr:gliding motility-associated C-terminal domain-containing protein [Hymenobacter edaphi]RAK70342.1 gliding motility-associated C-terminal domain-containing protein [Hymenobacter edaphi]